MKEAARLAREKSQERFELANPALNIAAPEVKRCSTFIKALVCLPTQVFLVTLADQSISQVERRNSVYSNILKIITTDLTKISKRSISHAL